MKTPAKIKELLAKHQESLDFIQENIDLRKQGVPKESIAWMPEKNIEFLEGIATGMMMMVEEVLFKNNCYAGFNHVGLWRKVPDGNGGTTKMRDIGGTVKPEEFAEWRRLYFVKG